MHTAAHSHCTLRPPDTLVLFQSPQVEHHTCRPAAAFSLSLGVIRLSSMHQCRLSEGNYRRWLAFSLKEGGVRLQAKGYASFVS